MVHSTHTNVDAAHWALLGRCSGKPGLDTGGVEYVRAGEGRDLLRGDDDVQADGTVAATGRR